MTGTPAPDRKLQEYHDSLRLEAHNAEAEATGRRVNTDERLKARDQLIDNGETEMAAGDAMDIADIEAWKSRYTSAKSLFAVATALAIDPPDADKELDSARLVAKEWLAAALALFGLLSFSAIFFGGDALSNFKTSYFAPIAFLVLTVLAVACALFCNFFGTRAAHGWPHSSTGLPVPRLYDKVHQGGLETDASAARKTKKAVEDLKAAMSFAAATVVTLLLALAVIVVDPMLAKDALAMRVFGKDGKSLGCGAMTQGDSADSFKLSFLDQTNVTRTTSIRWAEVGRLQSVPRCPGS